MATANSQPIGRRPKRRVEAHPCLGSTGLIGQVLVADVLPPA